MAFFKNIYANIIGSGGDLKLNPTGEVLLKDVPISDLGAAPKIYVDKLKYKVTSINTSSYNILTTDVILSCKYTTTGAVILTLPSVTLVEVGRIYIIVDAGGNANINHITVSTSDLINGDTNILINQNYQSISVYTDGITWYIH